jgi:hypothetical protein
MRAASTARRRAWATAVADAVRLDQAALARWRVEPWTFIEQVMHDPESGELYRLLPAEKRYLQHAFRTDRHGRLIYPEQVYACPKKSGKTAFAAMHALTTVILYGGNFAEATILANDFDQAQSRVFAQVRRIVESSPLLADEARITSEVVSFPALDATIQAIGNDYAGAAGGNQNIAVFDELWGYVSERSRRRRARWRAG